MSEVVPMPDHVREQMRELFVRRDLARGQRAIKLHQIGTDWRLFKRPVWTPEEYAQLQMAARVERNGW